jgi:hypothetical protein
MVRVAAGVLLTGQMAGTTPKISPDASTLDIMVQSRSYSELERQLPQAHLTGELKYFPSCKILAIVRLLPSRLSHMTISILAVMAMLQTNAPNC